LALYQLLKYKKGIIMETSDRNNPVQKPNKGKRILKITAGIVIALILVIIILVVFIVPAFISSESGKRFILSKANAAGAGDINFSKLSMSWFKGINVTDMTFKSPEKGVAVAVKDISTKPAYAALLGGNIVLEQTVIDQPRVEIDANKMKEEQTRAGKPSDKEKEEPSNIQLKELDLTVKDGDVKIRDNRTSVEITKINSKIDLQDSGRNTKFDINSNISGDGTVSALNANGQYKTDKNWDFDKTSGDVSIEVNNLGLASLESILAIAGVDVNANGTLSADIKGKLNNGIIENLTGNINGRNVEYSGPGLSGDKIKTSALDVQSKINQTGKLINIQQLIVSTDWLKADATGAVPASKDAFTDFMKPDSKSEIKGNLNGDLPAIAAMLPNTLGLDPNIKVTSGKLTGDVRTITETGVKMLEGHMTIDGLAGNVSGKPVSITQPVKANAKISGQNNKIRYENIDITSSFANINGSGDISEFESNAQIDLARFSSEIGQFFELDKYKISGQVNATAHITNNENTAIFKCQSTINNLKANPAPDVLINEPNDTIDALAAIDKKTNVLLVKYFNANTSVGNFSVTETKIPLKKGVKEGISLNASIKDMDLAKVKPYLVMTKTISKDVQLGGIVNSEATLGFRNGNYSINTTSTKITNLLVKAPNKEAFRQNPINIIIDAEVNPTTKALLVNNAEITSPEIKIKGNLRQNIEGNNSSIQGNAKLDYDWKAIIGLLSPFLPELKIEGKRQDTINFSSNYPTNDTNQMLANLNAQAKVGFDKASYKGLNLGATNVDIKAEKGYLTIPPFKTTVNNGEFNFGGSADLRKKPAIFRTPGPMQIIKNVQLNVDIANKMLFILNPIFSGTSSISGIANLDCNEFAVPVVGGTDKDYNIAGTISLSDVRMPPTSILGALLTATRASGSVMQVKPTAFTVRDGYLQYTNMELDAGGMPINFTGKIPIDPNKNIETCNVKAAGIAAAITGTPSHPKLDIGKTLIETGIQQGLEQILRQQKKGK